MKKLKNKVKIETERLEIIPLEANELRLWLEDINLLEKNLNCCYKAEPIEEIFKEIIKGQLLITEKDEKNYLYHTFWLILRKLDRIVIGSIDFKDVPNENHEVEIGYGLGKEFEHNGYMTETVEAFCKWASCQNGIERVIAETDIDGFASQNILKRCGFSLYEEKDTLWWQLNLKK